MSIQNAPQISLPVSLGGIDSRARFITRTYLHLFGAIIAFTLVEMSLFISGLAYPIAMGLLSVPWLLVLGAFVVLGWMARGVAHRSMSRGGQYLALTAYIIIEAIIFVPLLMVAQYEAGGGVIQSAALITLLAFAGLTFVAFTTRKDFSFMRGALMYGGIIALVLIAGGLIFGFNLGLGFSVAMVALAGAAVLYDTSNIIHHYPEDRYVAASLELFASVALMFWYVLRIVLRFSR